MFLLENFQPIIFMSTKRMKVGIIGAGFAGQMFSLFAKKNLKHFKVELFEKFQTPEAGKVFFKKNLNF